MSNLSLYLLCTVIWSTTWLGIHYQIGIVAPAWSICYRFLLGAIILFVFSKIRKQSFKFNRSQHLMMAIMGSCTFCLNFMCFYYGSMYMVSGLVAVASACIIVMNTINGRIILGSPIKLKIVLGSIVGIAGVLTVFSAELAILSLDDESTRQNLIMGFSLCILASYFASLGQVVSIKNYNVLSIPLITGAAYSMLYGGLLSGFLAIISGQAPSFDMSFSYISSLLYLTIIGSVIAFVCYLHLMTKIGAAQAAYVFVLLPALSLILSSVVEGLTLYPLTYLGIVLILLGNVIVMGIPKLRFNKSSIAKYLTLGPIRNKIKDNVK